ncbi:hypothetical protein VA249_29970 [Vibrio alfacsensis]|uniref:hypothetical protein n=1 Tax=Vibrio alfacsensis TaxID=1074311 RepID=UPI001BEE9D06|nr:hypothetical protein [Vibrio alfacsensis]BBM66351.1 hypothetical protein VA249_29970 [Vibrio alfacsensis]
MSESVKLKLIRGTVIKAGVNGVKDEIIEVDQQTAKNLRQAGAAVLAEPDAKVGAPSAKK